MNIEVGQKALITCDAWFYAPNGQQYRSVFGTVKAVRSSEETLGVRTNAKSTNWYVEIGCMTIAGCQIHYVVRCNNCDTGRVMDWRVGFEEYMRPSAVFDADKYDGADL